MKTGSRELVGRPGSSVSVLKLGGYWKVYFPPWCVCWYYVCIHDGIGAAMARAHQRERERERYCLCSACLETNNRRRSAKRSCFSRPQLGRRRWLRESAKAAFALLAGKQLWVTQINSSKWRKRFLCTHYTPKWTVREANFILLQGAFPCIQLAWRASLSLAIDAASAGTARFFVAAAPTGSIKAPISLILK